ncbi:ribosome silencing factor [Psychrobacter sp. AOP22-C1-22]|uniref:ribosome silencing factor n=1 Tax=unclassified Psychrobacter TaxID=196806 RepID=UPI00178895AD|nr:ribosome silencing factor [Psychrobacter sp. FME6]MBE0407118.1 ribosome silencing factor [Psychrobacter sp. FME6]MDN5801935.1 ribosome silencing factor [Psychrobacter sp.]MDN5897236.1 ribosome silencing factor [Psychrobacter sp.]
MTNTMTDDRLKECLTLVESALDNMKAKNITVIDVEDLTDVMERIVIADGTSKRHVRAMADSVGAEAKQAGFMPLGREGGVDSDWTLIDLGAVVVHMMTPQAREFYDLEGLWSSPDQLAELVAVPREKKAGRRN